MTAYTIGSGGESTPPQRREHRQIPDVSRELATICLKWLDNFRSYDGWDDHEEAATEMIEGMTASAAEANLMLIDRRLLEHNYYQETPKFMNVVYRYAVEDETIVFDLDERDIDRKLWYIGTKFDRTLVNRGHITGEFGQRASGVLINDGYIHSDVAGMALRGLFINLGHIEKEMNIPYDCPLINTGTTGESDITSRLSTVHSHIVIGRKTTICDMIDGHEYFGYDIRIGGQHMYERVPPTDSITRYLDRLLNYAKHDPAKITPELGKAADIKQRLELEIAVAQEAHRRALSELFRRALG